MLRKQNNVAAEGIKVQKRLFEAMLMMQARRISDWQSRQIFIIETHAFLFWMDFPGDSVILDNQWSSFPDTVAAVSPKRRVSSFL